MHVVHRLALGFLSASLLATAAARADDDWEERWEDYQEELEERAEDRRDALEDYWEDQRESQRDFTLRRGHAWYGYYGSYYGDRVAPPRYRTYGPSQFYAPAALPGYYNFAPDPYYHVRGCSPALGCQRDIYHHDLAIGPLGVFCD